MCTVHKVQDSNNNNNNNNNSNKTVLLAIYFPNGDTNKIDNILTIYLGMYVYV